MFQKLNQYLNNPEYCIVIKEKYIYIKNFTKIIDLQDDLISVEFDKFNLKINGEKIKLKQVMDNEIKFDGKIESINYYYK